MKTMYLRLDDACPKMHYKNWIRMEELLKKYDIKPLVGIIPKCEDPDMAQYEPIKDFWTDIIPRWKKSGWVFALHGYEHVFRTEEGGINPVNKKSEFAGLPLNEQKRMISSGIAILRGNGVEPQVFFAPAHTFDLNTLLALTMETNIRYISDTPANDIYKQNEMTFIPQQSGHVRKLPFKTITFCYHPNIMSEKDFEMLEDFIIKLGINSFELPLTTSQRHSSIYDRFLMKAYYCRHNVLCAVGNK